MGWRGRRLAAWPVVLLGMGGAGATERPVWPGGFAGRVQALAVLQGLNATLLASRSATFTLESWCGAHRLAPEPRLVATLRTDIDKPASPDTRVRLAVGPDEPVKYRRVLLSCGEHVLSEADNWYVPGRLTPEMNRELETTKTPFGRAVQALRPTRQTFGAELLWRPLSDGWEMSPRPDAVECAPLAIPDRVLEHRAVLTGADGRPFSEVDETYTAAVLAFPPPAVPCP